MRLFVIGVVVLILSAGLQQQPQPTAEPDPVLVGAGDIASCALPGDDLTAKLLDNIPGTVFTVGDNVYPNGTADEIQKCYAPTWGRYKKRTRPALGNHDYNTFGAQPYFDYFGKNAGPEGWGYYSYDRGAWHIIVLNSNIDARPVGTQGQWLRDDLEKHKTVCTLVYWHHPVFSSLEHDTHRMEQTWTLLYEYGVDVVVNGDIHMYERMAPQDPNGIRDSAHGIRQFIVGTGGATLGKIKDPSKRHPNSEVINNTTWGVIKFTLHERSYDWEFIPVEGGTFHDSGFDYCVGTPEREIF